ncbi:cysteine desulfurase family protein [Saccharothrix obliqua]|uniref:cysteine desulfurase family protein n=1 Tax=Saccharothrix obliqua TaxID=2861747 RepID=UPI001C5E28A0|nr:aminotransferase class V-fold PLP-dependent enzyme [Saccharothrix obliqua]MBW4718658.1 cysteine desulfurase [Saccharothrix obliqua]
MTADPGPIYLDHNATTPVDPAVLRACLPYLRDRFGNPSSGHAGGRVARAAVDAARAEVAALVDAHPGDVVFTGGGSDGVTLAVRGAVLAHPERGRHVVTQVTEHPAVLENCVALTRLHGYRVTRLPVDRHGLVDPADLAAAITGDTALVSIMHANNETGSVQPVRDLARIAHERGALFHCDAAQSVGKIAVSARALDVDLLSFSGHKLYAPKGIGALYVRSGLRLEPSTYGGGQERGLRGGTENVPHIAALGEAARLARTRTATEPARLRALRDLLHRLLVELLPGRVVLHGHPVRRLPNTLNVAVVGTRADAVLAAAPGLAASAGSACHAGLDRPSPVLLAMGVPQAAAMSAVRLSVGRWTTEHDVTTAARLLADAARSAG